MSTQSRGDRWFRRSVELLVLAVVVVVGFQYYERAVKPVRHRSMCETRLRQLSLALHSYHNRYQCFPPAYTFGSDGKPWHSWRILILPELGELKLFDAYRFDEPWNSPQNAKLAQRMPEVFGFPGEAAAKFLAVTGQHTAWPNKSSSRIREFHIGTSNSILLVESADSNVNWLEPRDIPFGEAMKRKDAPAAPRMAGRFPLATVAMADGKTRSLSEKLDARMLSIMLRVGPTGETRRAPPADFPPQKDASAFVRTDVLPVPTMPISSDRNYLYCATVRIAWDQLRKTPVAPVLVNPISPLTAELNRVPYSLDNIDPGAYFASIFDTADAVDMKGELHRHFPGAAGPTTPAADRKGVGLVLFAYLLKSLPFADEFDGDTPPLLFPDGPAKTPVDSFGGSAGRGQVHVVDYRTNEDFIVVLKTESQRDVMLLAKIAPEATMQETIDSVLNRVTSPNPLHQRYSLDWEEDVRIPKLSFNIMKSYDELCDAVIDESLFDRGQDPVFIIKAEQATAFVLNERGAKLESTFETEGFIAEFGDFTPPPPPPKVREFHFDRPFLVLLREQQSDEPYFAVWVANTELLKPTNR